MLCVTGNEPTIEAWLARIEETDSLARRGGVPNTDLLHELRLDALLTIDQATFAALERVGPRVVVCCRPLRQGGRWTASEVDRLALLTRAWDARPGYVDVEADVPNDVAAAVERKRDTRPRATKRIASFHAFDGLPRDLDAVVRMLASQGADLLKLAVHIEDASEIMTLLSAFDAVTTPRLVIAMGDAGLVSRSHYAALGSPFTFVAAHADDKTAPGQLDLGTALAMGLPRSASAPLVGLMGGPQVMHSPGPAIHNRLFRARGVASSYVPILTRSLTAAWPLIERIDASALSVTMPLKHEALSIARPDAVATRVGAANSLRRRDGWEGTNTDVVGVREPLAPFVRRGELTRAVVLGSGGAARAAVAACRELGLKVTVVARHPERAYDLACQGAEVVPWLERLDIPLGSDAVLLNATPLAGADSPWPSDAALDARIVFDTAIDPRGSVLLDRGRAQGAVTLDAQAMWLEQAAAQMSWFLDAAVTRTELEELFQ